MVGSKLKNLSVLAGVFVFLGVFGISEYLIRLEEDRDQKAAMVQNGARIGMVRARLESEINSTMFVALGLSSFVSATPDFSPAQFEGMAAMLVRLRPAIRNVGLAPDNVLRYVFPLKDNQKAIGLSYMDIPEQRSAVVRMMAEKQPVTAGPVTLVQGGEGLINRIPVYPVDAEGQPYYWGLAAVVVDPAPMFVAAGLDDPRFAFALRGKDGKGAQGEMIRGDDSLFSDPQAVVMDVLIPGGTWQLAGRPVMPVSSGWLSTRVTRFLALFWSLGCGAMAWMVVRAHGRIRMLALQDPLTGIPNRRYLERIAETMMLQALRANRPFSILHLDLDNFKKINDRYGHRVGDQALVYVTRQARATLRKSDFMARVGGDEFLVLLPDTDAQNGLHELVERMQTALSQPLDVEGRTLYISASIGWATYPESGDELDQLIRMADARMYSQKSGN